MSTILELPCLGILSFEPISPTQVIDRIKRVWRGRDGALEQPDRFVQPPGGEREPPQFQKCLHVLGVEFQGPLKAVPGVVDRAFSLQNNAEKDQDLNILAPHKGSFQDTSRLAGLSLGEQLSS